MTLALKAFAWLVFGFLIMALPLFLAAGTLAWPAGWIYLILLYGWLLISILLLLKYNPGLLAERINISPPNQKAWDKVFLYRSLIAKPNQMDTERFFAIFIAVYYNKFIYIIEYLFIENYYYIPYNIYVVKK